MTLAAVHLWGRLIGAVSLEPGQTAAVFQYDPDFARSAIQVAPFEMPLAATAYSFPALPFASFHGLPGLLSDSLPDKFGNALIDVWLARQNRSPGSFDAVERLLYTGARGMGALEFRSAMGPRSTRSETVDLDALVNLASEILSQQGAFTASLAQGHRGGQPRDVVDLGRTRRQ